MAGGGGEGEERKKRYMKNKTTRVCPDRAVVLRSFFGGDF
jgi:hypothetical protein